MEINLEKEKKINLTNQNNIDINKKQNNFLESNLGKIINTAINIGLRFALPDFIENQIISVKDALLEGGIKEGVNSLVKNTLDIGKSFVGIATGNFENISQIEAAIEKGGIIDSTSSLIDNVVNKVAQKGKISSTTANMLKKGKSIILDNISANIEDLLTNQIKAVENIEGYCTKWEDCYINKNFDGMEKEYKNIKRQLEKIVPLENTINKAKEIENRHLLIKNNGKNFELSNQQIQASKILV